jgi:hypothetical protein
MYKNAAAVKAADKLAAEDPDSCPLHFAISNKYNM